VYRPGARHPRPERNIILLRLGENVNKSFSFSLSLSLSLLGPQGHATLSAVTIRDRKITQNKKKKMHIDICVSSVKTNYVGGSQTLWSEVGAALYSPLLLE